MPANIRNLSLTELKFGIFFVNYVQNAVATDDFAIWSALFERCFYFHIVRILFVAERNSAFREVVGRHLYSNLVTWQDFDVMHAHLARNVSGNLVSVFELYAEHSVRKGFDDGTILFNSCLFCHSIIFENVLR